MNILILNWKDIKNPEAGGAEVIAFEFARRLVRDGHTVTFFSRSFNNCLPEENKDGVRIIRKGGKFSVYLHAYSYYKSLKIKPDRVIDMVNTVCWQTPLYVPRSRRIVYVNQLAKEVLLFELPWPFSWLVYSLERYEYLTYKTGKIICYSKSTKDDLISFNIPKDNISIFSLGIDHSRYSPGSKKEKDPLFIFVARLVKMKRADLCISAIKVVINQYPNARLVIIGNGPDEARLKNMVVKNKLSENVEFVNKNNFFINKSPQDTKISLMRRAWALLLPSIKEGWGMVITETAACGTPSIVSNVTGLRDSVIHNETGMILSQKPSPEELADAMCKLIQDKGLREKYSKKAIAWGKKFNWDKSYLQFNSLLFNEK